MDKEIKESIKKIADTYGYDAQSRQCIEEMAELTKAINKFWRKILMCGKRDVVKYDDTLLFSEEQNNIVEEMADVQIMLWQLEYLLNADTSIIIQQKLDRQIQRIEDKN